MLGDNRAVPMQLDYSWTPGLLISCELFLACSRLHSHFDVAEHPLEIGDGERLGQHGDAAEGVVVGDGARVAGHEHEAPSDRRLAAGEVAQALGAVAGLEADVAWHRVERPAR